MKTIETLKGGVESKVWNSKINGWRGGLYKYKGRTPIYVNTGSRAEVMQTYWEHWKQGWLRTGVWLSALTLKLFERT